MEWKTNLYPVVVLLTVLWITRTVGNLLTVPINTVAKLGDRVELECSTNKTTSETSDFSSVAPGETTPFDWHFSAIPPTDEFIYRNGYITHNFSSKYAIDNSVRGRYNLIMNSVDFTFAGTYTCGEESLLGEAQSFFVSAELIVIETDPVCNTSQSPSQGGIIEGDCLRMWCTVNYSGNWIPVMDWTSSNGKTMGANVLYTNTSTTVTSSLIMQINSSHNGVTFTCKTIIRPMTTFNRTAKQGEVPATNIPAYEHLWNFKANVWDQSSTTYVPSHALIAITGISFGALIPLIAIATIICEVRKRGKAKPDIVLEAIQSSNDASDRPQPHQSPPVYAEVQRNSNGFRVANAPPLPIYALVRKETIVGDTKDQTAANNYSKSQNSIPVYAEVKKPEKENKIPYATGQIHIPAEEKPKQNFTGADGTQYVEMNPFSGSKSNGVPIKHPPMFSLVETYASIDHTTAPPPPPVPRRH